MPRLHLSFVLAACSALAHAQLTLLDPTFGTGGIATVNLSGSPGDRADDVTLQPDGRIVIAATPGSDDSPMAVVRLLSNGSPDADFSGNGIAQAPMGQYGKGRVVAVQPDGRILLAGSAQFGVSFDDLAIARFTSTGALDNSFSDDGRLTISRPGAQDVLLALAVGTDGSIVAAGKFESTVSDMACLRLSPDGDLDGSFGVGGIFETDVHTGEVAEDLELRPDGRVVLGGTWRLTFPDADLAFVQLQADGTQDPSFGVDGLFRPSEPNSVSVAVATHLLNDGRILFAGKRYAATVEGEEVFLGRITTAGDWDASFGNNGRAFLPVGPPYAGTLKDMAVLSNGKTLLSCDVLDTASNTPSIMVIRAMPDGSFDTSFGNGGRVLIPCPGGDCSIESIVAQPDDHVVAVGTYATDDGPELLAMRWLPELSPVGIEPLVAQGLDMTISPNPATDVIAIALSGQQGGPVALGLYDQTGRLLSSWSQVSGQRCLRPIPEELANGTYYLRAQVASRSWFRPLIISR